MKTNNLKFLIVFILTIIYNIFFWDEYLGINLLFFSLLLTGLLLYFYPDPWKSLTVKLTVLGTIVSGIFVVIHNSGTSKLAHIISFVIMAGFIHQAALKTIYYSFMAYATSLIKAPALLIAEIQPKLKTSPRFNVTFSYLRLSLIPLIILTIFYWIYKIANPVFNELSSNFWDQLGYSLTLFFQNFSVSRMGFIILGFWVIAAVIFKSEIEYLLSDQSKRKDGLSRLRIKRPKIHPSVFVSPDYIPKLSLGLKNLLKSGVLLVIMVNLLLLIVNIIDIRWVWFDFQSNSIKDLSQFVHEGTYMLILSIFLSMIILLYYFRGNLNFYKRNRSFKIMSYAWIIQNAILALSVGIRNYHYIDHYGLAYKRIGVIIFLALTVFGLITMYFKIRDIKSSYFLYRTNTWALYAMLILMSLVNWDVAIAKFNTIYYDSKVIDRTFLLTLSDKTLDILVENKNLFNNKPELYTNKSESKYLYQRAKYFIKDYEQRNLLSWNYAEYQTYQNLLNSKSYETLKKENTIN